MKRVCVVAVVMVVLLVVNLGFDLLVCWAQKPYDPWSMNIFMYRANPGQWSSGGNNYNQNSGQYGPYWNGFANGQSGAPQWGPNYNQYGYNSFNPYSGPSMPGGGGLGSLGFYDYRNGPPVGIGGGGGNGVDYGYPGPFMGGYNHLYGLYGFGQPQNFYGAGN